MIYKSIIRPRQVKTQKVAEVEQRLRRLGEKRKEPQSLLYNVRKDLIRLHAEMDSVKGERERITREMAAEETWWLYICSFMPSKAADFTRRRQRQTRIMSNMIGKQRTKERDIDRKQEEQRFLKEKIDLITTGERELKAEIRQIERDWQLTASRQERERTLAKQRAQEDLAREFYARNGRNQSNFRYY